MRKIIVAAVLGGGLLMSGCSGANPFTAEKLPDFSGGFSSTAELTYGKLTAQADIDRIEPGSWEFTFTAPEELSGVVMTIKDGKLSASLGEISVEDGGGDHTALPLVIAGAIDGLSGISAGELTEKDGVLSARSDCQGARCTVTIDKATGDILSVRSPSNKLSVYFSDVSPYTADSATVE